MRIHVVLRKGSTPENVSEVIRAGEITNVNQARARMFGIITGDAPPAAIPALRRLEQVEAVEVDDVKNALSG